MINTTWNCCCKSFSSFCRHVSFSWIQKQSITYFFMNFLWNNSNLIQSTHRMVVACACEEASGFLSFVSFVRLIFHLKNGNEAYLKTKISMSCLHRHRLRNPWNLSLHYVLFYEKIFWYEQKVHFTKYELQVMDFMFNKLSRS